MSLALLGGDLALVANASEHRAIAETSFPALRPAQNGELARRYGAAAPHLEAALRHAAGVAPTIAAAVAPAPPATLAFEAGGQPALGATLAVYATNVGADPQRFESFAEAARRLIDGGATTKQTPAATSRWFHTTADAILTAVGTAEAALPAPRGADLEALLAELRIVAQLARFHGHRTIGAVRYNLFKRSLRLAELVASVYDEKAAVAAWRDLVAASAGLPQAERWRVELKTLEFTCKELEDQCCPPDEATLKEKVWQPATDVGARPPGGATAK